MTDDDQAEGDSQEACHGEQAHPGVRDLASDSGMDDAGGVVESGEEDSQGDE